MSYFRIIAFTLSISITLFIAHRFSAPTHSLQTAYQLFERGENRKANGELESLSLPAGELALYRAYIARAENQIERSQELLHAAAQQSRGDLLLEIKLNQCLNSYLEDRGLQQIVEQAAQLAPNNHWVIFFKAIAAYQRADFATALPLFLSSAKKPSLSKWMEESFEEVFTPFWEVTHVARCQIEQKQIATARQSLEKALVEATGEQKDTISFLLGLSYAKEAEGRSAQAAQPYWKRAAPYLCQAAKEGHSYHLELLQLACSLERLSLSLLEERDYQSVAFYGALLQGWQIKEDQTLISKLVCQLDQAVFDCNEEQIQSLSSLLFTLDSPAAQKLEQRFQHCALEALSSLEGASFFSYLSAALALSSQPEALKNLFANRVEQKILEESSGENIQSISPFFRLWSTLEKRPAERKAFAKKLLEEAEKNWSGPNGEIKAPLAIEMAFAALPSEERRWGRQRLQDMITTMYEKLSEKKLPSVLQIIQDYHLTQVLQSAEQHIDLAKRLIDQQKDQEALFHLQWVLQIKPNDQEANLFAARLYYHQAEYAKVVDLLHNQPLEAKDEEILTVSKKIVTEELFFQKGLSDDSALRIALLLLTKEQAEEALVWLNSMQFSAESAISRAYAYYLLNQNEEVSTLLQTVEEPYLSLDSVQGLQIQSAMATGAIELAEKSLIKLLGQPLEPNLTLSPAFQLFKQQKLVEFDRYYLAGLFFKDVKKNPSIANKYFQLLQTLTPMMRVRRAEALLAIGEISKASTELQVAVKQGNERVKRVATPLLAMALSKEQYYLEASSLLAQTDSVEGQREYAAVLRELRRFDRALELYRSIKNPISSDQVGVAECLFHLNQWEECSKHAETFLQQSDHLEQKLSMACLMAKMGNLRSTWPLLKEISAKENLSTEEQCQLLRFLMEIGAYTQASYLVKERAEIKESFEGLLLLAKLNEQLSEESEALNLARLAKALEPNNLKAYEALGRYGDSSLLESLVKELERRVDQHPHNVSLQVAYAEQLTLLGHKVQAVEEYQAAFHKALFLLEKMQPSYSNIAKIDFIRGDILSLLGRREEAIGRYKVAVELDPSYSEVSIALAKELKGREAIKELTTALHYCPSNAKAWQHLASLYRQQDDLYEASRFYQNALKYNPNAIELYLSLAEVLLELRNPEDAKTLLEHALKKDPKNLSVLTLLLKTLYDPLLVSSADEVKELVNRQKQVFESLHQVSALDAENLIVELQDRQRAYVVDIQETPIFAH